MPLCTAQREFGVVAHQKVGVALGRGAAGAHVQDLAGDADAALRETLHELRAVHVFREAQADEVAPLFGRAKVIDDQNVIVTAGVQPGDEVGADEAGAAGDDDLIKHVKTPRSDACIGRPMPRPIQDAKIIFGGDRSENSLFCAPIVFH